MPPDLQKTSHKYLRTVTVRFFMRRRIAATILASLSVATAMTVPDPNAQRISSAYYDGADDGTVRVTFVAPLSITSEDRIVVTIPPSAIVEDSVYAVINDHSAKREQNERRVTLTPQERIPTESVVTITLDEVFLPTDSSVLMPVRIVRDGMLKAYGVAVSRETAQHSYVHAGVVMTAAMGLSTDVVTLGPLSVHAVRSARQTYRITANVPAGMHVYVDADGPLRRDDGLQIPWVRDREVTAGDAEYGISVTDPRNMDIAETFHDGDVAIPTEPTLIASTMNTAREGSFDIIFKAAIDASITPGAYTHRIAFTLVPKL